MSQTLLDQRVLGVGTALDDHTITASDVISFADVGASNAIKKDTVQGVLDLASGGKVLQVVSTDVDGATNGTSGSYATTLFTAAITPTAADSKVLVIGSCEVGGNVTGSSGYREHNWKWHRDIGGAGFSAFGQDFGFQSYSPSGHGYANIGTFILLDSPTTTSACTYTLFYKTASSHPCYTNTVGAGAGTGGNITMIEVGA